MLRYIITNKIAWSLLLCVYAQVAYTQQPLQELKRTMAHYKSLESFSTKLSVAFYTEEVSKTAAKISSGSVEIKGSLSHSVYDGRETIVGNDFILMADHANQAIYYSPREKSAKKAVSDGTEVLDSVFLSKYHVTEKSIDEAYKAYRLTPKNGGSEFTSLNIKIDTQKHILSEISYIYSGNIKYKKVTIKYTAFNPVWVGDKKVFTEAKYISGRQKNAALQPAYTTYKLINSFTYDPKKNLIDP